MNTQIKTIVRFNLRKLNKNSEYGTLYVLFRRLNNIERYTLGLKCKVSHWSNKAQKAIISNLFNNVDNHNNKIINDKIIKIKSIIEECFYSCDVEKDLYNYIKQILIENNIMSTKKNTTKTLENYIDEYINYTAKQKSLAQKTIDKHLLYKRVLCKNIVNILDFNAKNVNEVVKGFEKRNINDAQKLVRWVKTFANWLKSECTIFSYTDQKIDDIYEPILPKKEIKEVVCLTKEETELFYNYSSNKEKKKETAKLFYLLCHLGCRISDLGKIIKEGDKDGIVILLESKKTKKMQLANLNLFPKALELLRKFNKEGVKAYDFTSSGVSSMFDYQLKEVVKELKINKKISSHVGRKTLTNRLLEIDANDDIIMQWVGDTKEVLMKHYINKDVLLNKTIEKFKKGTENLLTPVVATKEEVKEEDNNINDNPVVKQLKEEIKQKEDYVKLELYKKMELYKLQDKLIPLLEKESDVRKIKDFSQKVLLNIIRNPKRVQIITTPYTGGSGIVEVYTTIEDFIKQINDTLDNIDNLKEQLYKEMEKYK